MYSATDACPVPIGIKQKSAIVEAAIWGMKKLTWIMSLSIATSNHISDLPATAYNTSSFPSVSVVGEVDVITSRLFQSTFKAARPISIATIHSN